MGTEPSELARNLFGKLCNTIGSGPKLKVIQQFLDAQRAASVRVVETLKTNTLPYRIDLPAPLDVCVSLEPGQSLAIIERPAEAAAQKARGE